jgi:thiamine-monophosphate kinase
VTRKRRRPRNTGEIGLIRRLTGRLRAHAATVIGPGDDAAVVRPRGERDLVITTDAAVDGVHYRRAWARVPGIGARLPLIIGARLAAANLSDLAAMGATPRWAVLSAGVTAGGTRWLERAERALSRALEREGASLVGGNLCRVQGPEWLSLTLIGEVRRGHALRRSGAKRGHWIAVTGFPGRAAAFVALANAGRSDRSLTAAFASPPSRVAFARAIADARLASAAIDVSDGVAGDLAQLCRASRLSALLVGLAWPADRLLERARLHLASRGARKRRATAGAGLALRLGPSDDYELILAVPPARRARLERLARDTGTPLAFVGRFTPGAPGRLFMRARDGRRRAFEPQGYDHFARASERLERGKRAPRRQTGKRPRERQR